MSIKKRAVCVQKVSMGRSIYRCPGCGHIDIANGKIACDHKCPLCQTPMESVADETSKDSTVTLPV